ncbi:MAG TPA: E3 binding domain-containing protein, partial [Solirubrobacterales bacterium]|nr:E3 binding domain-containing protein [Solirubrobacterales bacterium]
MEEGTVLQWLKSVGDDVAVGDELVEIETDKANMAYEADLAGTLTEILVNEGETVAIGTPIARVGDSDEGSEVSTAGPVGEEESAPPPAEDADGHRVKASPLARRIAKEQELDLSQLQGSGPGGRIVKADVENASSAGDAVGGVPHRGGDREAGSEHMGEPTAAGPAVEGSGETAKGKTSYEDLSKTQQLIARRMSESKATAPHFYLRASVDMSRAVAGRKLLKEAAGEGDPVPSFNDMVVKACALA